MIRDITIGQYYSADSPIHRLDPRVKLAGTMLYIIALFVADGPLCYAAAILFLAYVIRTSKVPLTFMLRGMRSIILILLLSVSFNLFLSDGVPIADIPVLRHITWEGLQKAVYMGIRLVLLILGSTVMTLTTTPNALTDGMEKGLGFLKIIHVPVHEIAMMMSIALRFIPILLEETDKIMKAQLARGADFGSGSLIKRVKGMVPLLIPLFVSAFRRAADLALALEARCYHGGDHRTRMKPLRYTSADRIAYLVLLGFVALVFALRVLWRHFAA